MIGPVILPLDAAVAVVASASFHEQVMDSATQTPALNQVHVFDMVRAASGQVIASHASHSSHSSHVSSVTPGGGYDDYVPPAPITYTVPAAPSWVNATGGNGSANISWAPVYSSDGSPVTYTVISNPGGISVSVVNVTTVTLRGLQNGVSYSFTVTASNAAGQGPVSGGSGTVTPSAPLLQAHRPGITGQAAIRQKLEAVTPGWAAGTSFSYQWFANGARIAGATNRIFVPTSAQAGKAITVAVVGAKPGFVSPAAVSSVKTHLVATASVPTVAGHVKVGSALTARAGTWTAGTKFVYSWYADGVKIAGQSKPTLVLTKKYSDKAITVRVSGSKAGYGTVVLTSSPTGKVRH